MDLIMIEGIIGFVGSLLIAGIAYWRQSLSFDGFAAAVGLGTAIYVFGDLAWYGTLIAFFISSTLLSKMKQKAKREAEQKYTKTGRRDAYQVLANGGGGLFFCLLYAWSSDVLWWYAFIGVMSAVTADTWATEVGSMSRKTPLLITTWKPVPKGTSGGITVPGLLASIAGGLFIGGCAYFFELVGSEQSHLAMFSMLILGGLTGLAGSLIDSWLGAKWQVMYKCTKCGTEIEKQVHCDKTAKRIRGSAMMTNDTVNALASLCSAAIAVWIAMIFMK